MSGVHPFSVRLFVPQETQLVPYLAAIHANCINHDSTIATFLPPLSHDKLLNWWKECIAEVAAGGRFMILLLDESEPKPAHVGLQLMGVVTCLMPFSETGSMRGFVEKLLVSPKFRRRGGARALMAALEAEAFRRGRTLLLVDAETGSPAETVYKILGFTEVGKVPKYSISPTGDLKDETFFYKQL